MSTLLLLLLAACKGGDDKNPTDDSDSAASLPAPRLVPQPVSITQEEGSFTLTDAARIAWEGDGAEDVATLLAEELRASTGLPLMLTESAEEGDIALTLDPDAGLASEGYTLVSDEAGVQITAADTAGLLNGTQTLRQLLPPEALSATVTDADWVLPAVTIDDAPRFAWRGLMLDVARHFFTVAEVERQIDVMAQHKLNRLHVHLTDDQGWRIEIRSWPLLTEIGGASEVGGGEGGWYSQDDWAELVAYGARRGVTVLPEIDLPGHANAACSAYAELNPDGEAAEPYTGVYVISTGIWLDGPDTAGFVEDVWDEVSAMSPSSWAHVGADEAVTIDDDDYAAFIPWLQGVLSDDGKTLVGWDEIGALSLETPFAAQRWWSLDDAVAAAEQGGGVISSPAGHTYLDMKYDARSDYGQTWAGFIDVETSYDWDPVEDGLVESDVLGVEGALWTEYIDDQDKMDFMVWPRESALAELGWSPLSAHDWADFSGRLAWHGRRLDALGVGFYASPEIEWYN